MRVLAVCLSGSMACAVATAEPESPAPDVPVEPVIVEVPPKPGEEAVTGNIEVTVEGVKAVRGQLLIGVFTSKENFRKDPQEGSAKIEITEVGPITARIEGLEAGTYAVVAVWDVNESGELDTGAFGMPQEAYAFSNDPKFSFSAPDYEECTFVLTEKGAKLKLVLDK